MTENWNVFAHIDSEPSEVEPHQYWSVGVGSTKEELPVNLDYDKLIPLNESSINNTTLSEKVGRSKDDLLGLLKESRERGQTIYISMSKWVTT